jgi:hypothetical protein
MSDKHLEQRINIKFCVEIVKSARQTLAILTVVCVEYAAKKLSLSEWHRLQGRMKLCKMTQKWAAKNIKDG